MTGPRPSRRDVLATGAKAVAVAAAGAAFADGAHATTHESHRRGRHDPPDLVLVNGRITTLDRCRPTASALAVTAGRISAVGDDHAVRRLSGPRTRTIDLRGRRVIPGLNDSHTHLVRQGLSYTHELSLLGVSSVAEALRLIRRQAEATPAPQWVRVVGGFSRHQFREGRLPTVAELNRAGGDTPVFLLNLYDRAIVNAAGMRVLGYDRAVPPFPDSEVERDARGRPTGVLIAKPNATILYSTLAELPVLDAEAERVSTLLYLRHLNRRGVTSVVDAGGGGQRFPDDYRVVQDLHRTGELSVRIGYHTFTQENGAELADFRRIASEVSPGDGDAMLRMVGAGEMLVYSAADFEDFRQDRPTLPPRMERDLTGVLDFLAERRWPFRLHATYDESITRFLDVIERVHGPDGPGSRFILDHAETISSRNIDRVAALGGGIAVQGRMAFQGEDFVRRYGRARAADSPPVRRMAAAGVPVGLGTDATRVASDNLWQVLHWLVSGRTLGGLRLYPADRRPSRTEALRQMTSGSAWMTGEEDVKGRLEVGQHADLAVLSQDYLTVAEHLIPRTTSVLTLVGGRVVHAEAEHRRLDPPRPAVLPGWSPLASGLNSL